MQITNLEHTKLFVNSMFSNLGSDFRSQRYYATKELFIIKLGELHYLSQEGIKILNNNDVSNGNDVVEFIDWYDEKLDDLGYITQYRNICEMYKYKGIFSDIPSEIRQKEICKYL